MPASLGLNFWVSLIRLGVRCECLRVIPYKCSWVFAWIEIHYIPMSMTPYDTDSLQLDP